MINVEETRNRIVALLNEKGFLVETAANADFSRGGKDIEGTDVEFTIGTSYGEVAISMKQKGTSHRTWLRAVNPRTTDQVLAFVDQQIEEATLRGEQEGWL